MSRMPRTPDTQLPNVLPGGHGRTAASRSSRPADGRRGTL